MLNVHNLPEPLVKALTPQRSKPVPGRIGVTALIDSPLRRLLNMRHFDEIEEDASDSFWALIGKSVHYVIEQSDKNTEIKIQQPVFGATLVGVVDYFKDGHVIDWKTTSVWSAIYSDGKDWEKQLQCYAYLLGLQGHLVKELSVYMILRDWQKREAQKGGNYPSIPFKQISYDLWSKTTVEAFIQERVSLHLNAEKSRPDQASNEIPTHLWCTPTERWKKEDKWAVMKKGQVRAVRLYDSEEAAEAHFDLGIPPAFYIEHRPGEDTRCASYCSVNIWCPYYTGGLV